MRSAPAALLAAVLGALALACDTSSRARGAGLVLLPSEDPLPPGVLERDPRLNYHDFGHVPDGEVVRHAFRLRNGDPGEVAIQRVVPGCGCSVASLRTVAADGTLVAGLPIGSKAEKLLVVPPGGLAEVEIQVDTRTLATKNADKLIITNVTTDSPNGHYLSLEVHIFVEKPFEVVPGAIQLGRVAKSAGGTGAVDIVPVPGHGKRIKEIRELPAGVSAELASEERMGIQMWVLRAGFEPPLTAGLHQERIVLATEDEKGAPGRPLEVALLAQAVEDIVSDPERLVFAATRTDGARGRSQVFSLLSGQRLKVLSAELPAEQRDYFEVAFAPLEQDAEGRSPRWEVTLATRPPLSAQGVLAGKLLLHLDDPQHESFELPYVVHLR